MLWLSHLREPIWPFVAAGLLFAAFVFRAFAMMHECVHSSAHAKRWVNNTLGEVYGVLCFLPFMSWRDLHLDHHKWTGNVERDPSMKILVNFQRDNFTVSKMVGKSWLYWIPLLGFMQNVVFWKATISKREYKFGIGSIVYLGLSIYFLGPLTLVIGFIAYLYLVEIINCSHHLDLVQWTGEVQFRTYEQDQFARSCVYPKCLAHFLFLNFNLHAEHHLFPTHPWYQLDALHRDLRASEIELNTSDGTEWILHNRRRKVEEVFAGTFAVDRRWIG